MVDSSWVKHVLGLVAATIGPPMGSYGHLWVGARSGQGEQHERPCSLS
jgi:hypothetical protein